MKIPIPNITKFQPQGEEGMKNSKFGYYKIPSKFQYS